MAVIRTSLTEEEGKMQEEGKKTEQQVRREVLDEMRFHFIFNSLNAIRYMIYKNPDAAYSMVYDLSVFLRGNIDNSLSHELQPLSAEMKHTKAYLDLEVLQSQNMEVVWMCDEQEGYVEQGSVYRAAEQCVKCYVRKTREKRTIMIDECPGAIRVWVAEEGEKSSVFIAVTSEEGSDMASKGRRGQ